MQSLHTPNILNGFFLVSMSSSLQHTVTLTLLVWKNTCLDLYYAPQLLCNYMATSRPC